MMEKESKHLIIFDKKKSKLCSIFYFIRGALSQLATPSFNSSRGRLTVERQEIRYD